MSTTDEELTKNSDVLSGNNYSTGTYSSEGTPTLTSEPAAASEPEDKSNYITEQLGKGATDPTKNQNVNTGSGAQAASGTSYSWEDKAAERAQLSYKSDVLTAKQDALAKRQELETQAQQYQLQSDMQKYADNQSAEKAGWAGGYVLDQNRQREYLQQSINASMFNSMQLQKYGYESQLQAARLAYDSNMLDLAMEYYQQAVQNSINEAQVTGIYISAEQKDMLSQWNTAAKILEDSTTSEADREQAQKVSDSINSWFAEQNISPAGIKTLGMISAEMEVLNMRTAIMEAAYNRIPEAERNYTFVTGVDENYDPILINLNDASKDAILDYVRQEGSKGEAAKANLNQYFKSMMDQIITDYFNSTTNYSDEGFKKYTEEHKELQKFINMFESEDSNLLLEYIDDRHKFAEQNLTNDTTNITTRFTLQIGNDGKFIWKSEEQTEGGGLDKDTIKSMSASDARKAAKEYADSHNFGNIFSDTATIIDVNSNTYERSQWGNFSGGDKQDKLYKWLENSAKDGTLKEGDFIKANYGVVWSDHGYYMYLGNGMFIRTDNATGSTRTNISSSRKSKDVDG